MTAGLTVYTLRSKTDFSYLGAGLGAALWVLLLGGLLAMFVPGMHLALAMGGAVLFSAYIVRSGRSLVSPPPLLPCLDPLPRTCAGLRRAHDRQPVQRERGRHRNSLDTPCRSKRCRQ